MTKLKITESRKKAIKKNYNKLLLNHPKRKNELRYFQMVKAGKKRAANSFRSKAGKIQSYPERFIKDFIEPFAKSKGMDTSTFLKMKSGREISKMMFKDERLDWHYNINTVENFLKNRPLFNEMYIFDGENKYKVTETELRKYLSLTEQTFLRIGRKLLHFKVSSIHSFTKTVFWLPNLSKVLKLAKKEKLI